MKIPTSPEIKDAYREAAMKSHPDRLPMNDPLRKTSQVKFLAVSTAYKALLEFEKNNSGSK